MSKEQTYTVNEIREIQCEKCTNYQCQCKHCKGVEPRKCNAGKGAGKDCDWVIGVDPICYGFQQPTTY